MGDSINSEERDFVLTSLSDLFAGVDLNEDSVSRLRKYPIREVKRIYFREVSVACAFNFVTTTPEMGGFDPRWLKEEMSRIQIAKTASVWGRIKFEAAAVIWGLCSLGEWRELRKRLEEN